MTRPVLGGPAGGLLTVLCVTLVCCLSWPRDEYPGDPVAIRMETRHLLETGRLGVDPAFATVFGERGQYYFYNQARDRWFPKYGLLNSLVYVPALWAQSRLTGDLGPHFGYRPRTLALNITNLAFAALSAAYLYALLGLFRPGPGPAVGARLVFVLLACFGTFWWNYLRAHSSEVYQAAFLLALHYHLFRHGAGAEPRSRAHPLAAALWLAALVQVKVVYVLYAPLVVAFLWLTRPGGRPGRLTDRAAWRAFLREHGLFCLLPLALGLLALLWVQRFKFGSAFDTGYTQWQRERHPFSGNLLVGLAGYLASPQGGVFLHFPLLFFALFAAQGFLRRHRAPYLFVLAGSLALLLVSSQFVNWRGENCYGPRYLLPVLPLLALPAFTWLADGGWRREPRRAAWAAVLLAASLFWGRMQMRVNETPFFSFYGFRAECAPLARDEIVAAYFAWTPFPFVSADLADFVHDGRRAPILQRLEQLLGPAAFEVLAARIRAGIVSNYWWDGPAPPSAPPPAQLDQPHR